MKRLQLIGVEDEQYRRLRSRLLKAMVGMEEDFELEEVNDLSKIIHDFKPRAIPSICLEGEYLFEPNGIEATEAYLKYLLHKTQNRPIVQKILVPVDFSEVSFDAFRYALHLADYLNAEIELCHVYHPPYDVAPAATVTTLDSLATVRQQTLEEFRDKALKANNSEQEVKLELNMGFAADEIIRRSKEVDWIVMGKTGEGGIIRKLFGSVSSQVAKEAHCPTIFIPGGMQFQAFREVLYASDYTSANAHSLQKLANFSTIFSGRLHMVHVHDPEAKNGFELESLKVEKYLKATEVLTDVCRATVSAKEVWQGLNQYADQNQIDLMVVVTPHRNFWQKIFHKSVSKAVVGHAEKPVMVLHI